MAEILDEKPAVDEALLRKTAKRIVTEVFGKEYNLDNSQTQRMITEMLTEAGFEIKS